MPSNDQVAVLKEFLMSLGFVVDTSSNKKFNDTLVNVTKRVSGVSKGLISVITAAEGLTLAVTYHFEKLYYASKRVKDSVGNVQAFSVGVQKIGIASEAAQEALENLAQQARTNPGIAAFFSRFSKGASGAQGMINAVRELKRYPYFIGAKFAQMFGIPEQMFFQMTQPGALEKLEDAMRHRIKLNEDTDLSVEELGKSSADFQNQMRDLVDTLGTGAAILAKEFLPSLYTLNEIMTDLVRKLVVLTKGGKPEQSEAAGIKLKSGERIPMGVGHWKEGVEGVWVKADGTEVIPEHYEAEGGDPNKPKLVKEKIVAYPPSYGKIRRPGEEATTTPTIGSGNLPLGLRLHNPGNLQPGGIEAEYATDEEGLAAMASLLKQYSSRGMNTVRSIISRWAPAEGNGNTKETLENYISSVSRRLGVSDTQVLNMQDPAVIAKLMDAQIRVEQGGAQPFSNTTLLSAAQSKFSGGGRGDVTVNASPTMNINVDARNTGGNAEAIGRETGRAVNTGYGDIVRNFASAAVPR